VDLVGYDVLRAPGVGGWTFSVGVRPKGSPTVREAIASQAGVWSLERDSAGQLILRMGESVLTADAAPAAGECAGVAVSFRRGFAFVGQQPTGRILLVVNGRTVAQGKATIEVSSDALARPTALGNTEEGGRGFVGALLDPSLLSVGLTPAAASELSQALCAPDATAERAP